ncbi:DNA-binding protein [Streptomyces hygroscopicus subsp. limoneus]|nr:DNA-binding protein [Streptomyces hygroscopicus subsp. limoneus]
MSAPAPLKKNDQDLPATGPEATGASMRARAGDEILVRGTTAGVIARDGEIVGLHHPDDSPPYDVRRADSGRVTLYFAGPDAHIRHPVAGGDHARAR